MGFIANHIHATTLWLTYISQTQLLVTNLTLACGFLVAMFYCVVLSLMPEINSFCMSTSFEE